MKNLAALVDLLGTLIDRSLNGTSGTPEQASQVGQPDAPPNARYLLLVVPIAEGSCPVRYTTNLTTDAMEALLRVVLASRPAWTSTPQQKPLPTPTTGQIGHA